MTAISGGGAPTLEMVAAHAGVSRATVSRVVNGSPKVSPDVAEVVQRAIEELNYVPNRAARSLASRRTQAIALIVPESAARVFDDPFFASIVQGVAMAIAPTEYTLTMMIESEVDPDKTRRYLLGGNVDGALVVSHHTGDHSYAHLGRSLPLVFGGRPLDGESSEFTVDVDNTHGAASGTEHLVARGRRRLATIAGPQDMPPGVDRLRGFESAASAAGLATDLVEFGDFSPASGADAMRRLLAREPGIDGVFAANDQMAMGALTALAEAGRSVPDDVSVVGFDDDRYAATAMPALTTVRQPSNRMGAEMARKLVALIEGRPVEAATILSTELVVRASS
ncbi:LacI family DNA-binding transcriptional regulator [Agromyces sp. CFH 90414]|uniref:LacI family DNA-binding transcriptional regulator n=1 Tax=Agromyces agglutinans TaxID=2662258 RepID=A0A6I2FCR0_9MICO|nr:LacI family DNA-binding transcriptional regulator [Agromyces agglutinans]MRG59713.1 LacI family DNA-binding transcriptional regulator [Agromyces agglutinans]